jgi:hypothetical protein
MNTLFTRLSIYSVGAGDLRVVSRRARLQSRKEGRACQGLGGQLSFEKRELRMLSRSQLPAERLPERPAVAGDDCSDLWGDLAWLDPALSCKIYRPKHHLSVARFRGRSARTHHLRHSQVFRGRLAATDS